MTGTSAGRSERLAAYYAGLSEVCGQVFAAHPELPDHRAEFPWLTGSLGDPFSPVWFVAENPSLTQVEKAVGASPELQWSVSRGDKLFREMLCKHGFKSGEPLEEGGWRCYVTDVMKSAVRITDWQGTSSDEKEHVAGAWAPAMRYELEHGRPEYLVFLGKNARKFMRHQRALGLIPNLPANEWIYHYSYLMHRPAGKLGPGHPDRLAAWEREFADIASRYPAPRQPEAHR